MILPFPFAAAVVVAAAQAASASGYDCTFACSECRTGTLHLPVELGPEPDRGQLLMAGKVPAIVRKDPQSGAISLVTDLEAQRTHLLTIFSNGSAVFTAQAALYTDGGGAFGTTYLGTCAESP